MNSARMQEHFAKLTDPRRGDVTHPLINIITIAVCAVICSADDFVAIAAFGRSKREWFAQFLDLTNGIPSHDCFNRVLGIIRPAEFEKCLLSWITALQEITDGQVIAVDGKTLRGSFDKASGKSAIHMVSAWATANHVSLGQVVTDEKSNEITAIPKLLEILEIAGAIVTIDAMGCQTQIAEKIVESGATYCLAVKGNQPTLHQGIMDFFDELLENDFADVGCRRYETCEKTGRKTHRMCFLRPVPDDLPDKERWEGLKAIGFVLTHSIRNGEDHYERRYYILSRYVSGRRFAEAVRSHWGVENNLHWQLDVTFGEDGCRIRKGHADANFSLLRRTALSLLKNESSRKVGIKNKRLIAGWDDEYMLKVLCGE